MKKKVIELLGWYGTVALIGAYALVSFSLLETTSLLYQLLNATGALGIVLVSLSKKVYQPAVLNTMWTIIALVALFHLILTGGNLL